MCSLADGERHLLGIRYGKLDSLLWVFARLAGTVGGKRARAPEPADHDGITQRARHGERVVSLIHHDETCTGKQTRGDEMRSHEAKLGVTTKARWIGKSGNDACPRERTPQFLCTVFFFLFQIHLFRSLLVPCCCPGCVDVRAKFRASQNLLFLLLLLPGQLRCAVLCSALSGAAGFASAAVW